MIIIIAINHTSNQIIGAESMFLAIYHVLMDIS